MTSSAALAGSKRLCAFLTYIVEEAIRDPDAAPKEVAIALELYGREEYDSRTDTLVRVDAGRLRRKLAAYYEGEGQANPFRLELPRGGYRPVLYARQAQLASHSEPRMRWTAAAGLLMVLVGGAWWLWGRDARVNRIPLAVLPLVNRSGDARLDRMTVSLAREAEQALVRAPAVEIVPLADPATRRRAGEEMGTILRRLRGSVVIEGTLTVRGDRVRAVFQALDADRGFPLWSETLEEPAADLLKAQTNLQRRLVSLLRNRASEMTRRTPEWRTGGRAARSYMDARYLRLEDTEESTARAVELLRGAVEADPGFGKAWSLLADSLQRLADLRIDNRVERYDEAAAAARRAIRIDPQDLLAHLSLGSVLLYHAWDFPAAEQVFRRAVQLEPESDDVRRHLSDALMLQGRFDEALATLGGPARTSVFSRRYLEMQRILVLQAAGRTEDALEQAQRLAADFPDFPYGYWLTGNQLRAQGRLEEARTQYRQCLDAAGGRDRRCSTALAHVEARLGKLDVAHRELAELEAAGRAGNSSFGAVTAMIRVGMGQLEAALDALELSARRREANFAFVHIEPQLAPLRGHERFQKLLSLLVVEPGGSAALSRVDE